MQAPHLEDEVYLVLEGRAHLKVGEKDHIIKQGSILFVKATEEHSFFNIEEDLTVLTIFGASIQD